MNKFDNKPKSTFNGKSIEELALEMDNAVKDIEPMTDEEIAEYDAEYGYFGDED